MSHLVPLWDRERVSSYGWKLRLWINDRITRFVAHVPPYDADVLRYKILRFLLRDVRPERRHDREAMASFLRWCFVVVDGCVTANHPPSNDGVEQWQRDLCCDHKPLESHRFELEEYDESDSADEW